MKSMRKLSFADLQFDKKWEHHSAFAKASYISGIIPKHLIYSKLSGHISEVMVNEAVSSIDAAYRDGGFEGTEFIRFADYSYLTDASLNARRTYAHAMIQMNEKYHCNPRVTYIIGANFKMRMTLKFFSKFIKQKFIFVDNIEDAFEHLYSSENRKVSNLPPDEENGENGNFTVTQEHLSELISAMGYLTWEKNGKISDNFKDVFSEDNPLRIVEDALSLTASDIVELRQNEEQKTNELSESVKKQKEVVKELEQSRKQLLSMMEDADAAQKNTTASLSLIEATLESTADGILVVDTEGKILRYNNRFAKMWRLNEDVLASGRDEVLLNAVLGNFDDPEAFLAEVKALYAKSEQDKTSTDELRLNDGRVFERYSCPQWQNGTVIGRVWSFRDITERKQAEELLRAREARWSALTANFEGIVQILGTDGTIKFMSRVYPPHTMEDVVGKSAFDFMDEGSADKARQALKDVIAGAGAQAFEIAIHLPDGAAVPFEVKYVPQFKQDGSIDSIIALVTDITERKEAEQELAEYMEELYEAKDLLEQNTGEMVLANVKLEQSEKDLMESNANKDKFFSIISHDLKSPFNGILGITEMLVSDFDELTSEEAKEMIHLLRNSSVNVYNLLEGLLEWAQTQTGRMEYEYENIDIHKSSTKIIELLKTNAQNKNIFLKNGVKENTLVFADKRATETVLRNLITNAIKFTKPDGIIKVETEKRDSEIAISVSDSGIGMSDKDKNKLFKIEVHHTTVGTNNEAGTGVGLILCKELVEKHGGKIWVESELGVGSKFIFTLSSEK
ncbi:MAG: PAS domain S-box protein [Melioribacteraceae bacterium]|nr:PAS domain S-box protein [Melioribacteraceae bacterium]